MMGDTANLNNFDGTLVLLGAGKMGQAMANGWLASGLGAAQLVLVDPALAADVAADFTAKGATVLASAADYTEAAPAITVIAIKPQMMEAVLPGAGNLFGAETMAVSIAAGTSLAMLGSLVGEQLAIVRAMPNTPAAIGKGMTALIGNAAVSVAQLVLAESLMQAVGQVVLLEHENQMNAVTALSGSGPAYVFYLAECMAAVGGRLGLPEDMAKTLARATVEGAGALMEASSEQAVADLRQAVTSPGGTTQAALDVLMAGDGLREVMGRALEAAAKRSRELAG